MSLYMYSCFYFYILKNMYCRDGSEIDQNNHLENFPRIFVLRDSKKNDLQLVPYCPIEACSNEFGEPMFMPYFEALFIVLLIYIDNSKSVR